jgi:hypothetical protein
MTLEEAYSYIDMLLDKADQPYFTTEEKNRFLNMAISDFISAHYQRLGADEDSRMALSGCIDFQDFLLTEDDIFGGAYVWNNRYPALSEKFGLTWHNGLSTEVQDRIGYFKYGNQLILPKKHLYVMELRISTYNKNQVIDQANGLVYSVVTVDDIVTSPLMNVELVPVQEHYNDSSTGDPFKDNKELTKHDATLIEGRLVFKNGNKIRQIQMTTLTLPSIQDAFDSDTYDATGTIPASLTFKEHYQKQIIEIAVNKMTQVDVGLMTGPAQ